MNEFKNILDKSRLKYIQYILNPKNDEINEMKRGGKCLFSASFVMNTNV
jgi:hypothetical protein